MGNKKTILRFKKIFIIFIILGILSFGIFKAFGEQTSNITICSSKEGFERYKCQKDKICKNQEFGKAKNKVVNLDKDFTQNQTFQEAKKIYSDNQNKIYKCGILESQRKVYNDLIKKLVNTTDKTGILKSKIIPKIKQKLSRINTIKTNEKCNSIAKNPIKKAVLDQSFYELCKFEYFSQYIYSENKENLDKSVMKSKDSISFKNAEIAIIRQANEINKAVEQSVAINTTAFKTYSQYDDFLKTHIMLELIKEDYKGFRDGLYQMLHPINQTVYKVINAQNP